MAKLVDAQGVSIADVHRWLPDRVALWPHPPKIVNKDAAYEWKLTQLRIVGWKCWWCNRNVNAGYNGMEVHHIVRHDAPWAFALLCATCHRHTEAAVHADSLPRLLVLKHRYDRENTSWCHLALGLGRRLPVDEMEASDGRN